MSITTTITTSSSVHSTNASLQWPKWPPLRDRVLPGCRAPHDIRRGRRFSICQQVSLQHRIIIPEAYHITSSCSLWSLFGMLPSLCIGTRFGCSRSNKQPIRLKITAHSLIPSPPPSAALLKPPAPSSTSLKASLCSLQTVWSHGVLAAGWSNSLASSSSRFCREFCR
jgi:hypothetical protein